MSCRVCGRRLGPKYQAAGIGPVCAKKERDAGRTGPDPKINFLSHPLTKVTDRRSWLYRLGPDRFIVKIYPGEGTVRDASCECGAKTICLHIAAVAPIDKQKFYE